MKTVFQLGFATSFDFWNPPARLGDFTIDSASAAALQANLNAADRQYAAVMDWLSKTINPRDALGSGADADSFQQWNSQVSNIYDSVTTAEQIVASGQPTIGITQDQYADLQAYMQLVQSMYAMVQKYGGFGGAPLITQGPQAPRPVAAPAAPAAAPKPGAPVAPSTKAAAAAKPATTAGPSTNDLLLGGGLAVGVGVALYALTRG